MKRIATLVAFATCLLVLTAHTARAAEKTITAPYDSADTINRVCDGCTESSASADVSGRIQTVTTIRRAALAGDSALASATGRVFASTNGSVKTRSISVTFTVNVASARALSRPARSAAATAARRSTRRSSSGAPDARMATATSASST